MSILIMIVQFLGGLSLLVFFHELGHFLAARSIGIRVQKFYLFFDAFDKRLFKFNYKGTEFGLGWLPFGGYTQMAGSIAEDNENDADVPIEQRYDQKPAWQRLIVMSAGVIMNLLFALIIYCTLFLCYGRNQITAVGTGSTIIPGQLGLQAGLQPGDEVAAINADSALYEDEMFSTHLMHGKTVLSVIRKKDNEKVHLHIEVPPKIMQLVADKGLTQFFSVKANFRIDSILTNLDLRNNKNFKNAHIVALNGDSVNSFNDFIIRLKENKQRQLYLTVIHNGKTSTMMAHRDKDGHIGFSLENKMPVMKPENVGVGQSLAAGTSRVWNNVTESSRGLGEMVTGGVSVKEGLLGPVRLATLFTGQFEGKRFWELVAMLSIGLALFNLIPIAPFDGGVVLILLFESLTRRQVSRTFWATFYIIGMVLIVLLTIYVFYNDIRALI